MSDIPVDLMDLHGCAAVVSAADVDVVVRVLSPAPMRQSCGTPHSMTRNLTLSRRSANVSDFASTWICGRTTRSLWAWSVVLPSAV